MPPETKLTPMMEQYFKIKAAYPDAFLFYRLGDFYELFYTDAIEVSQLLELTLTSRNKNAVDPVPMWRALSRGGSLYRYASRTRV